MGLGFSVRAVSNSDRASLTRPLEKSERPVFTHDSAVCSAVSVVAGEEPEEEAEDLEAQAMNVKRRFLLADGKLGG